jgi:hypothetical protein
MLTCRHTTRLLSERLDRRLGWFERGCLAVHLLGCAACRRFRRAIRWLQAALPSPPDDGVQLPDDARERIRRALEKAAQE